VSSFRTPPTRIVLLRHGRSEHVHSGWIDATGFRAWRAAYEAAGIAAGERVPPPVAELAQGAGLLLASDAPRALASARLLAAGREVVVSPLLRELDLHGPALGALRLPLAAWAVAVGVENLRRTLLRRYPSPAEAARLHAAADWLDGLARRPPAADRAPSILAVTHASFRRRLAGQLTRAGWRLEPGRRSLRPWSAWSLVHEPAPERRRRA
jgi:broad specificity phosphatase PhoE